MSANDTATRRIRARCSPFISCFLNEPILEHNMTERTVSASRPRYKGSFVYRHFVSADSADTSNLDRVALLSGEEDIKASHSGPIATLTSTFFRSSTRADRS